MNPLRLLPLLVLASTAGLRADPQVDSWMTTYAGKYARIYTSDANKLAGTSVTTWTNGTQTQSSPAYCGVQEISYSTGWVYIRSTGLGSHTMGPWYLNAAHSQTFPNLAVNQHVLYRIPRSSTIGPAPATKTLTGLGVIGYFVDGVAMFDSRDGFYWNGTAEAGGAGTGYWNRDAYVNEGVTFDPGLAHQENSGTHHYHANPVALRYLLGDHVVFNTGTKAYSESTGTVTKHSPILGWVRDGYPIYGPYGYGSALNAGSAVRRMVSGYVLRNGQNGTDNLTATRPTIPAWAQRVYNVSAAQAGPPVNTTYPLGRYMEDKAYLGDLGRTQGTDFDLDEYNGRYCVTPEFPNGTYAYFVAINADGSPAYPYNIGRAFYGSPAGTAVTTVGETVTTVFQGAAAVQEQARLGGIAPGSGNVALTWSSVEGGTYKVEAAAELTNWTTLTSTQAAAANAVETTFTETGAGNANPRRFYRVTRTALATYDPVTGTTGGGGGGNGIVSVSPVSAARGATLTLTVNLNAAVNPPPMNAPVNSVTIGTIAGTNRVHTSATQVTAQFTIPANAATGAQTVTVVFPGPPGNPTATVTYTLANGFTVN